MIIPFKAAGDFQTSRGRVLVFSKDDPRVETLKVGDIVTTKDGCWKLTGFDAPGFYIKTKNKDDENNYKAFYVHKMGC